MERTASFGYWLRRRRKALDLTQEDLARQVGCAVGTIKKLEGDDRRPSRQFAERLADLLAISPAERPAFLKAARAELATDQLEIVQPPIEPRVAPPSTAQLPGGTVTFLFTDIEGSTQLWTQYPEAMRAALARHAVLLQAAIETHGGAVFKTVGDAFYAAFAIANDAVSAALAAQRSLQAEDWGATGALRVRMALHTGTAETRDSDYFGHTLNRIARILNAGHGGQILLSATTWELLRDHLPPEVALRNLGAHWLKSLTRPEQIYQCVAPDLPADFPPLRTLDHPTTNLPAQPTAFIGREKEIAAVRELLSRDDTRLVTLRGPGGTGKTRLGLQVATRLLDAFPDGVWFVNLAPLSDPGQLAATIAQTFSLREVGGQPIQEVLKYYLRAKRLLLLLDNFEQIAEAAPLVATLLAVAPGLTVLVTSRIPLHLSGEREYAVPPLALPDPQRVLSELAHLAQYEAVQLFIERAQAARGDFAVTNANAPVVAAICARLDGLPLAIELVAARVKLFPPQALLGRLGNRLKLLTGGAHDLPERQQTIRNTIDWSYQLLDASEQTLFARLGVFVGGCTIEAAEAVCNAEGDLRMEVEDGIAALTDKSLLRQAEGIDGEPRFTLLETIREYALERLEQNGAIESVQRQHMVYYLALAEAAEPQTDGPDATVWLDRLEAEHDNFRAVLIWSQTQGDAATGLRLAVTLSTLRGNRGYYSEIRAWLERFLSGSPGVTTALQAKALRGLGGLVFNQDGATAAHAIWAESLALFRTLDDQSGIAELLNLLGWARFHQGDLVSARALFVDNLARFRALNDQKGIAWGLNGLAATIHDPIEAQAYMEESLRISRVVGARSTIASVLNSLGDNARERHDIVQARVYLEESLDLYRKLGNPGGMMMVLNNLGYVAYRQHDRQRMAACFAEALKLSNEAGAKSDIALSLGGLGGVANLAGKPVRAARLFGAADVLLNAIGQLRNAPDDTDHSHMVATTRAALGDDAFAAARAAGRAMPLAQAIAEALGAND